jgi:hypothetical protein
MVNHPNRKNPSGRRYVSSVPKSLAPGRVLVHNHVLPQIWLGLNGFRAWTQRLDSHLMPCPCKWAGADLHGLPHYRMASANPWAWEDEAVAEKAWRKMFKEAGLEMPEGPSPFDAEVASLQPAKLPSRLRRVI